MENKNYVQFGALPFQDGKLKNNLVISTKNLKDSWYDRSGQAEAVLGGEGKFNGQLIDLTNGSKYKIALEAKVEQSSNTLAVTAVLLEKRTSGSYKVIATSYNSVSGEMRSSEGRDTVNVDFRLTNPQLANALLLEGKSIFLEDSYIPEVINAIKTAKIPNLYLSEVRIDCRIQK